MTSPAPVEEFDPGQRPTGPAPLLLLVEDDASMQRFLRATLADHGFRVVTASSGREAIARAAAHNPAAVILDLGLPDMDGLEVTGRLREWSSAPVLVVSAREQEADKVTALDAGANDFITKPFSVGELLARVRVWLRHVSSPSPLEAAVAVIGDLYFDFGRGVITLAGTELRLTRTEYELLALFVRNRDKVLSHRQILSLVWGPNHREDAQYVRVYVGQLRRKIERDPARPKLLVTEAGVGYRLRSEPRA